MNTETRTEEEIYRDALGNKDTLQFIQENGNETQKAKAFDELVKMQMSAEAKTEPVRPSESGIRVPFPNRLIDKG